MGIDKAAAIAGIPLERDVPAPGHRTVKDFGRLISTIRRLEAEVAERLQSANELCQSAQARNIDLQEENAELKARLLKHELEERCATIGLSDAHTKMLTTGEAVA